LVYSGLAVVELANIQIRQLKPGQSPN
jgi:hypothetical protein